MATATNVDDTVLRSVHSVLANSSFKGFTPDQLHSLFARESGHAIETGVGEEQFRKTVKLYQAIAPQVTADEFVAWHRDGELPIVKLSPEQMEQLHGGILGCVVSGAMCVAVIALECAIIAAIAVN